MQHDLVTLQTWHRCRGLNSRQQHQVVSLRLGSNLSATWFRGSLLHLCIFALRFFHGFGLHILGSAIEVDEQTPGSE